MNRNLTRLIVAFSVSAICFLGTELWFQAGKRQTQNHDGKEPIAQLSRATNEVQRKEAKRVIWESISRNDELYAGEAVHTTENADADLVLKRSGATIHLDPDSLVVLEESANGLALDFLQGNMSVANGAKDDGLTLKTSSGEIKLSGAEMSLSKDKSGQVNLEVFKGQAELIHGGKKVAIGKDGAAVLTEKGISERKDRLQLLSPNNGETVMLNLTTSELLSVNWKPLAPDYKITAEIGPSRANLALVPNLLMNGEKGQLQIPVKSGQWYIRLTAQSQNKAKPQLISAVTRFIVEPKAGPFLIEPSSDRALIKAKPEAPVSFRWQPRNHYDSQLLEVSKDKAFKALLTKQRLDGETTTYDANLADGTYYWRVIGYLRNKGKDEGLSSSIAKLDLRSHIEMKPVTLIQPAATEHIPLFDAQKNGVLLKWQTPMGVERVKLIVQHHDQTWQKIEEKETEVTSQKLIDLKSGLYHWKVVSLDQNGNAAASTEFSEFTIDDMSKLEWASAESEEIYSFTSPNPTLRAAWKELSLSSVLYRFRVAPEEEKLEEADWKTTKQTSFDISVKAEGRYTGVVEALNAKNQPIAQSVRKIFVVKRVPLLPPPKWAENAPETLKTDSKGNLSFSWGAVEGAKQYMMILQNEAGQVVDKRSVSRTAASVSQLKPGQYFIKLRSVDNFQRPSEAGEPKKLLVPPTSDIRAPKIKAMKVK